MSKQDSRAIKFALVRIVQDSPQALYASDLHRMIEERTGFDVPMHEFVRRLLKLARKGRICAQRESQPPYRQFFMAPDAVLEEEPSEASPQSLTEVERLRLVHAIELSLQPDPGDKA